MGFFYRSTDRDPLTGIQEDVYLGYGDDEGKVRFERKQEVGSYQRKMHENRAAAPTSFHRSGGIYKSAEVPLIEVERWKTAYGFDWFNVSDNERRKWLNRSENARWKARNVTI